MFCQAATCQNRCVHSALVTLNHFHPKWPCKWQQFYKTFFFFCWMLCDLRLGTCKRNEPPPPRSFVFFSPMALWARHILLHSSSSMFSVEAETKWRCRSFLKVLKHLWCSFLPNSTLLCPSGNSESFLPTATRQLRLQPSLSISVSSTTPIFVGGHDLRYPVQWITE